MLIEKTNILIVDDEPKNLLALEAVLDDPAYNLIRANSGEEALHYLLNAEFAVVLLDVQMPGMDGFETAQMIRSRQKTQMLPIIFITGQLKDTNHISQAYSLKAVDYILKPFDPEILRTKVYVLAELYRKTALVERQAELLRQSESRLERMVEQRTEELSRSNAELEQFAYVASHDLQEPLRAISGYLQFLERRYSGKLGEEADKYINGAVDGAMRMKKMIEALLSYSRAGTRGHQFELTDCNKVLEQVKRNLWATIEESEVCITTDPLPTVMGDSIQLVQLFQNLIGNAIKYKDSTPPTIHISANRLDEIDNDNPKKITWQFSFHDNGIGIAPQFAERIFLVFQRLHTQEEIPGTGIGLAICKRIVERHGGQIWVESNIGEGSAFFFTIVNQEIDSDE